LPPIPRHIPVPKPVLAMTTEEEQTKMRSHLNESNNFPTELPVKDTIGKSSLMYPRTYALEHAAIPLLMDYATNGCPVDCGENWKRNQIEAMLERGPHVSATEPDAIQQAIQETNEKVEKNDVIKIKSKNIIKCNY